MSTVSSAGGSAGGATHPSFAVVQLQPAFGVVQLPRQLLLLLPLQLPLPAVPARTTAPLPDSPWTAGIATSTRDLNSDPLIREHAIEHENAHKYWTCCY